MSYETPILKEPMDLYETPLLVDVDQAVAKEIATDGCETGGLWGCEDIIMA